MSADLLCGSPANPQSLNRYAYVWNNPINLVDPGGFGPCITLVGGVTEGPNTPGGQQLEDFARQIRANVVFPYAGHGLFGSLIQLVGLDLGFENGAFQTTLLGLQSAEAQGVLNVITFSGGAQAFVSTIAAAPNPNFNTAIYISPGLGAFTFLLAGSQSTTVSIGTSFLEKFLHFTAPNPPGSQLVQTARGHNLSQGLQSIQQKIPADAGCPNPVVVAAGVVSPLFAAELVPPAPVPPTAPPTEVMRPSVQSFLVTATGVLIPVGIGLCEIDPVACACFIIGICYDPCEYNPDDCGF